MRRTSVTHRTAPPRRDTAPSPVVGMGGVAIHHAPAHIPPAAPAHLRPSGAGANLSRVAPPQQPQRQPPRPQHPVAHHEPLFAGIYLAADESVHHPLAHVAGLAPKLWVHLLRGTLPLQPPRRLLRLQAGKPLWGRTEGAGARAMWGKRAAESAAHFDCFLAGLPLLVRLPSPGHHPDRCSQSPHRPRQCRETKRRAPREHPRRRVCHRPAPQGGGRGCCQWAWLGALPYVVSSSIVSQEADKPG